jgi:hypothetical protein
MKKHQIVTLVLAFLLIVLFGLYPPWIRTDRDNVERPIGYAFLLHNPEKPTDSLLSNAPVTYRIDFIRLSVEWGCVVGLAAILIAMRRTRKPTSS